MRIAILGCGYVGLELGRQLRQRDLRVWGVRRSKSGVETIEERGLSGIRGDVTDPNSLAAVPDVDAVVFAASSGGGGATAAKEIYVDGLETTLDHFSGRENAPDRLVYTSSTGVHGDHGGGWVDEETPIDPTTEKTAVLARAEQLTLDAHREYGIDGTVARFAGLYGPGRYRLDRYLDGPVTEGYLNMIHRDDAAGAVAHLLETDAARTDVVQVVDDEPASKWAFADWLAAECGRSSPPKRTKAERLADSELSEPARRRIETSKRCANDRLASLGYELIYPTYRSGYQDAIKAYVANH
ncbi:SDR family oxidoreductase [Halovivax gelatinilyticus]|uniref:SDR family oxidoreductase n=1 Tax=Halovivax gelatinilyticus TaxID=2961597 RepID=UPI0020CA4E37|nr:SDR family oxidoreductase [Halovivax gelatinilyticus]